MRNKHFFALMALVMSFSLFFASCKDDDDNTPEAYTITVDSKIVGGTVTASPKQSMVDNKITLTATPDDGYTFEAYSVKTDGGATVNVVDNKYFMMPAANVTVSATFKANETVTPTPDPTPAVKTFTVTFDSDGGTTLDNQTVNDGENATEPTAPTKDGYTFAGWYNGESAYDFSTAVTADITLTAHWSEIAVTSIAIDNAPTEALFVNSTGTLTATVLPDNATDKTVTWTSSDGDVLTINASTGAYEAKAEGTATITATANGKTATYTVTVKQLRSITFTGPYSGYTLVMEYYEGDTWNDMAAKYPDYIKILSYLNYAAFYTDGFIYDKSGNFVPATAQIDPNETYTVE